MNIKDITINDIRKGKNWRIIPSPENIWIDLPMEEWGPIEELGKYSLEDSVVYSGIVIYKTGEVRPIVLVKSIDDSDYGGDYCERINGTWKQVGLVPNPNALIKYEFIANPLSEDTSFGSLNDDYRREHKNGFRMHVSKLKDDA
jgi:hypothetical protein